MGRGGVRAAGDGARRRAPRDELRRRSGRHRRRRAPRDRRGRPRRARRAQAQPGGVRRRTRRSTRIRGWWRRRSSRSAGWAPPTSWWARGPGIAATRSSSSPARGCSRRSMRWTHGSSTSTSTASTRVPLRSRYTALGALWLPRAITDADVVISMPKMKTHHWAGLTLSLKNCFGCVPGRVYGWPKNALHWAGLEQAILDVAAAVRPDYAIVDGIVGHGGQRPHLRHAGRVERPRVRRRSGGDGRGRRARDGVRPGEGLVPRGGGAVPGPGRHGSDPHPRARTWTTSRRTSRCSRGSRR